MSLLILGGTADAKQLAAGLHEMVIPVIYSVAGLVRQPELPCAIVSGGFKQFGGLGKYIAANNIHALLDATHPFAAKMSGAALRAARDCNIPVWRYQRPAWVTTAGDNWQAFSDWDELVSLLPDKKAVFFSAGQLQQEFVNQLRISAKQQQWLRSAVKPGIDLPESMHWVEDIGPFHIDAERKLFSELNIDALVTKNSGGQATAAKLTVARERGIAVYMLDRPQLEAVDREFDQVERCIEFVADEMKQIQYHHAN
ncbi:MAG: precorrin-6A/cobalt-precorrin-6A reductase [Planctomycetota bacterium]|jgi:precorrin-6A/cobalt-precorrin-6A reductase